MENVMVQLEMLKQLLEEVKVLKADYIVIRDGVAIGSDQNCTFIKCIKLKLDYSKCIIQGFNYRDAVQFIKGMDGTDYIDIYHLVIVNRTTSLFLKIADPRVDDLLYSAYTGSIAYTRNITPVHEELTDNQEFQSTISGKTGDGCSVLKIAGYPISIYSSLLPINKNDIVSLNIYDIKIEPTFIAEFTIQKKKNIVVTAVIRYLKI